MPTLFPCAEGNMSAHATASVRSILRGRRRWHAPMLFVREPGDLRIGHEQRRGCCDCRQRGQIYFWSNAADRGQLSSLLRGYANGTPRERWMPRKSRIAVANYPHHIVQRGHNRKAVFVTDHDRQTYLATLSEFRNSPADILVGSIASNVAQAHRGKVDSSVVPSNRIAICSPALGMWT